MYPLDPRKQSPWWDCNMDIIMSFDTLHRAVDRLEKLNESDCGRLKSILIDFASEMILIINKHNESAKRKEDIESLLKSLLKNRDEFDEKDGPNKL